MQRTIPAGSGRRIPWKDYTVFLAFVSPDLLLLFFFTYKPLFETFKLSLYNWDLISPVKTWVGLDNYRDYFDNETNRYIIRNTFVLTFATPSAMTGSYCNA